MICSLLTFVVQGGDHGELFRNRKDMSIIVLTASAENLMLHIVGI